MSEEEDYWPTPQPPRGAIPIGPAQGRQRGVQADDGPTKPPPPPTRTQRAQETRQRRDPAEYEDEAFRIALEAKTRDRHFVGEHPFDAALAELYRQRDAIDVGIKVLEQLKGQTP